ncbi:MAG: dCTP deaminase [Planctomycetales bacterium]|nr:dCTP deaminase [Planctomycetales bacterium]
MILTGEEIRKQLGANIVIDPFREENVNPNSYNLTLHEEIVTYEEVVIDMKKPNRVRRIVIPEDGLVIGPNQLYLARTVERTETHNLVPMVQGRSSISRLGLFVNITPGFGDIGFSGFWTLELFAIQPIRIYAHIPICQILYHQPVGEIREYQDKYQDNDGVQASLLHRELDPNADATNQLRLQFGKF